MVTRRQFLKLGATAVGTGVMLSTKLAVDVPSAMAFSQSQNLQKFIQPLRGVGGATGIPVAASDGKVHWGTTTATHYSIDIGQFEDQLHPQLPNPTRLWGYGQGWSSSNPNWTRHLGGIIVAQKGVPVQITATNHLPPQHILPVDKSQPNFPDAANHTDDACIHLHGGFVPWISDGGPMAFFGPASSGGVYGPAALLSNPPGNIYKVVNRALKPGQAEVYYPNQQSARMMWYHDHAHDTTRLNAYAGIATAYVVTDGYEASLTASPYNLPGPLDPRTIYMVFQDKIFVQPNIAATDPSWLTIMPNSRPGDLWYPHVYDLTRWGPLGPNPLGFPPDPSCVPEMFGDTMLVNGSVFPVLEVEQRQYRFRMLNACQARFLNPRLVYAKGTTFPNNTEPSVNAAGPGFTQIGTEGGFLPAPVGVSGPRQPLLVVAPAERTDLIVDFSNVPAGSILILYSDAPAPFPMGDGRNDYYPGNPKTPTSIPGYGPNTRTIMQIKVKARSGPADPPISLPARFQLDPPLLVTQTPGVPTPIPAGVPVRRLTLNETFDGYGRLFQLLGTDAVADPALGFGREYMMEATETPRAGSTEVWEIVNLTGDTHPIHVHLVNFQVLSRQAFSAKQYAGGAPNYQSQPIAPDPNELGWRETVRMNPGQVTRIIMKFDLPSTPFSVPFSENMNLGVQGYEYVWHCHILDHEEHDMMRPLVVLP